MTRLEIAQLLKDALDQGDINMVWFAIGELEKEGATNE